MNPPSDNKLILVAGHYGSGKTEFCINLALSLAEQQHPVSLVDLDLVNPYFRTREKTRMLESKGIKVYGNFYDSEVTMEIPALSARVRAPLENPDMLTIIDFGGNSAGALVAVQFEKYFIEGKYDCLCVINKNRPETADLEKARFQFRAIENRTGLKFTGLVNNTHLLRETTLSDIEKGAAFCEQLSAELHVPLTYSCCPESLLDALRDSAFGKQIRHQILPVRMIMRDSWLDQKL